MFDYVSLEADLSDEERMIRDTARKFVKDRVRPSIADHFEDGTFPTDLIPEMGELGFYAPNLDGYELPNISEKAYGLLMQELEACDSGLRSMASVQGALVMYLAWGTVGAARDCFEQARDYALDRDQFGGPIARFQLQQEKLAEMATQITTAQLLVHRLADLKERGDLRPQHVSMAKRNNVQMVREQSKVAREILGGNDITSDYSPMRHMANMETVYTYEGTHDIHTLILGQDLTGIAAFQ